LIAYTARALPQIDDLIQHYEDRERIEALRALSAALDEAEAKIGGNPAAGLASPRPYPGLTRQGRAWIKVGRYWVAYDTTTPPVIVAVFYEAADIPNRL
jgi:plasmid stabilization system protein ParE